jgi:cytoskeletal protein CcmA (bactofilin family)
MFSKKRDLMTKNNTEFKPNTIVEGTTINGDVSTNGDFRIDGRLKGSIKCQGKIVVGQTGNIDGEIVCQNADLSGTVNAKVTVGELLTLKSTARLKGEVIASKLSIEPGATFTGTCNMDGGAKKPIVTHVEEKPQQEKIFTK